MLGKQIYRIPLQGKSVIHFSLAFSDRVVCTLVLTAAFVRLLDELVSLRPAMFGLLRLVRLTLIGET